MDRTNEWNCRIGERKNDGWHDLFRGVCRSTDGQSERTVMRGIQKKEDAQREEEEEVVR